MGEHVLKFLPSWYVYFKFIRRAEAIDEKLVSKGTGYSFVHVEFTKILFGEIVRRYTAPK